MKHVLTVSKLKTSLSMALDINHSRTYPQIDDKRPMPYTAEATQGIYINIFIHIYACFYLYVGSCTYIYEYI
jgi:hypothetical protein